MLKKTSPILLGVLLVGVIASLLAACGAVRPSDGPGMAYIDSEYRTPWANLFPFDSGAKSNTVPSCAVAYLGRGVGESGREAALERYFGGMERGGIHHFDLGGEDWFLVIPRHKDSFSVTGQDGESLHSPAASGTPFTVRCDGSGAADVTVASRDGSFVLRVDGQGRPDCGELVLDVTDFETGSVPALPAETVEDFDGTWVSSTGNIKLVIKGGKLQQYWKDSESGQYKRTGSCRMTFHAEGDRALCPEKGETTPGLPGYSVIEKKGRLLYAVCPVLDAKAYVDVFALEGHEEDLPPEPVYVRAEREVSDRHIRGLTLFASCFDEDDTDGFLFSALPGCEEAVYVKFAVTVSRTGERLVTGEVWGKSESSGEPLLELHYPLAGDLEEKLAARLLTADVLEHNPEHDSSDMVQPTVHFTLEAEFASGERISMDTACGVLIGEAAVELAELLLDGAQ